MDRSVFQHIVSVLNFVLVKGVVKIGAAILAAQLVVWLWHGPGPANWPNWTAANLFDIDAAELASLGPPAALVWIVTFFVKLPLFLFVPLAGWAAVGLFYLGVLILVTTLAQLSAFWRQVIVRRADIPNKHIAICTDGTWNYPSNLADGVINGTNVFKFWDLLAGKRSHYTEFWVGANRVKRLREKVDHKGQSSEALTQIGFYYNGVGNKAQHTQLGIILGGAFGMGANRIVRNAYRDLIRYYRDGDTISICGFSRGAAIARLLASEIGERGLPRYTFSDLPLIRLIALPIAKKIGTLRRPQVDLLGVWDTVGAFGISKNILGIPFQRINLFKNLSVGETVKKTVHMLALDEERDSFIPTLITPTNDPNREVKEVWFAGNHSNVGGGYAGNNLSNIPLRHFCMEAHTFRGKDALPLLKYRSKEDLLQQDAKREAVRKAKLDELEGRENRELRPEEFALYGFDDEDELAPILYPDEGFEERIQREILHDVRREDSPVYENVPRDVPEHGILDDTVRYKMVTSLGDYQPESVMCYYKKKKASGAKTLEMFRALEEGGHITKEEVDETEALIQHVMSLRTAFTPADWLPEAAPTKAPGEKTVA